MQTGTTFARRIGTELTRGRFVSMTGEHVAAATEVVA